MARRKPRVDWVILDANKQVIECLRCGETRPLSKFIPASVTQFVKKSRAFEVLHEDCKPKEKN